MKLLGLALLCWVFAALNVAFVVFGSPELAPLSIISAVAAIAAGCYSFYVWNDLR